MLEMAYAPFFLGLFGLAAAWLIFRKILSYPAGTGRVVELGELIYKGAMMFMRREYTYLAVFVLVVAVIIFISDLGQNTAFAFLLGAITSAVAGYIGM